MSKKEDVLISRLIMMYILGLYCFNDVPIFSRLVNVLLLLIVFSQLIFNSANYFRWNKIDGITFAFCVYSFAIKECTPGLWSALLGINVQTAITILIAFLLYISVSTFACDYEKRKKILEYVSNSGVVLSLYSLLIVRTNIIHGMHTNIAFELLRKFGLISTEMGMSLGFSLLSSFYLYFENKSKGNMAKIIINMVFLFLTGSRKSLLFIIIGLGSIYILNSSGKIFERLLIVLLLSIMAYFAVMNFTVLYDIIGKKIDSLIAVLNGEQASDSTYTRYMMIEYGKQMIQEKPWLGHGYNSFSQAYGNWRGNYVYSHNNYIELMVSGGIVLTIVYYMRYLVSLIKLKSHILTNKEAKFYTSLIITIIVVDITSITYYSQIIMLMLGLMSAFTKESCKQTQKDQV